jgi:hypothetical protein
MLDNTVGDYFQEPTEQKRLLEAMGVSLGPQVGDPLLLFQLAPIGAILLVLTLYTGAGPS